MEGSWIIARPLAVLRDGEDAAQGGGATMHLADFAAGLEAVAARSRDALAMWRAGCALELADLGMLGGAVALAPTLGAALRAFTRGFGAIQSATSVRFDVGAESASFGYRILDPDVWPRRADAELSLGVVTGLVQRYAPDALRSCGFAVEHEMRALAAGFGAELGVTLRQAEDTGLTLPLRLLDRRRLPEPEADTTPAFREAMAGLEGWLRRQRLDQPVSQRVLHLLLERIGREASDQDTIARLLGLSQRSLRRQLEAEGRSFQELLDLCRRALGLALLRRTSLPLIEIAMRLGYADHTAFSRAFSRWFGASPRALRRAGSEVSVTT